MDHLAKKFAEAAEDFAKLTPDEIWRLLDAFDFGVSEQNAGKNGDR